MAAQLEAFGIPPDQALAAERAVAPGPDGHAVPPDIWPAVRLFVACSTQWRRAGLQGVPVGLDYAALIAVAPALGVAVDAELLDDIRILEAAALEVLSEEYRRWPAR